MTKYHNRKSTHDNIRFDSQAELARYQELKLLLRAGEITLLSVHPKFVIDGPFTTPAGVKFRSMTYAPDFTYTRTVDGRCVAEDVKGVRTAVYQIKRRLFMKAFPHIEFVEIRG